jgi:hypothetical protein
VGENCPYSKKTKVPELFQWFCAMCDNKQPEYMRKINKTDAETNLTVYRYRVCAQFVRRLMGTDGDVDEANFGVAFDSFDDCGLRIDEKIVVPSVLYRSPESFLDAIRPPYMPSWVEIEVVDDDDGCFGAGAILRPVVALVMLALALAA